MSWKPAPRPGIDLKSLTLSPLQGYVATRVNGAADVDALAKATGLPAERVSSLLTELVAMGAVLPDAPAPAVPTAPPAPGAFVPTIAPVVGMVVDPEPPTDVHDAPPEAVLAPHEPAPVETGWEGPTEELDAEAPDDDGPEVPDEPEHVTATHRELFETKLHPLSVDERVAEARSAVDPALSALCFDPVPQVIQALLENARFGLVQARLVARHHRNPVGLEAIAARAAFAADQGVRRGLLHNPILPGSLYRRLWGMRRLLDQFNVTISREVPDQTKRTARETMRARFSSGPAEERVELIVKTEGRCLQALTGLPVDSKTAALLCTCTYTSTFLVQNVARWSAAPPQLIAHLLHQELVRRTPMLRTLLEKHPNAPTDQS